MMDYTSGGWDPGGGVSFPIGASPWTTYGPRSGGGGGGGDAGDDRIIDYYDRVAAAYASSEKDKLDYSYAALRQQAKTAAQELAVDRWYKGKQIEIAWAAHELAQELGRGRLALDTELGRGQLELGRGRLGLDRERFGLESELGRGGLGLQFLGQAAQLRGPQNWAQYTDFLRGAGAIQGMPTWLNTLSGTVQGQGLPKLNALGAQVPGTSPVPATMGSLLPDLQAGGQSAGGGGSGAAASASAYSPDRMLREMRRVGGNVMSLPYGTLERLSVPELGMLQSGMEHEGFDFPSWLQAYGARRPGQGSALAA